MDERAFGAGIERLRPTHRRTRRGPRRGEPRSGRLPARRRSVVGAVGRLVEATRPRAALGRCRRQGMRGIAWSRPCYDACVKASPTNFFDLLLKAEHRQVQARAPSSATRDVEVNGQTVNPRLHLALHEIVANQLWDGQPPETWAAARAADRPGLRRRAPRDHAGRFDIVFAALNEPLTDRTDEMRAALDALGTDGSNPFRDGCTEIRAVTKSEASLIWGRALRRSSAGFVRKRLSGSPAAGRSA